MSATEKENALTAGQLIKMLSRYDPDTPVGVQGHFGEFYGFSTGSIAKGIADMQGWNHWKCEPFEYVKFPVINIGDEPD